MSKNYSCEKCGWETGGNDYWAGRFMDGSTCPNCASGKLFVDAQCNPTTQKALGVVALREILRSYVVPLYGVFSVKERIKLSERLKKVISSSVGVFARPCPPSPEHGFVESRVVKSQLQLERLRKETLKANPDSEIMLMHPISADYNAVLLPTLLTIGKGHDGATAGKRTFSVPLAGQFSLWQTEGGRLNAFLKKVGIEEDQHPYVEAVTKGEQFYLTQIRAGKKLENGILPDFIPFNVEVHEVIKTNGEDLLTWAKITKELEGKPGVVVYHPGGSVTDHYSVHCRDHNIPILTTRKPIIGEVILKNSDHLPPFDPEEVIKGLAIVDRLALYDINEASGYGAQKWIVLALLALHNSSVLRGPHSIWLGVAAGVLCKLGLAALEAEGRHAHSCYKGMKGKPDIYGYYASKSLSFCRARLSRITQLLHYGFGELKGQKFGYGGPKWALCGAALCPVFNAIRDVVTSPSEETALALNTALNIAINQAHNGGWWLNKFCAPEAYVQVPKGNIIYTLQTIPALVRINQARQERRKLAVSVRKVTRAVSRWPERTEIRQLRFRKASLEIGSGEIWINLKPSTLPKPLMVNIPTNEDTLKSLVRGGRVVIEGGKINLVTDGKPKTLWEENPLQYEARPESISKPW